MRTPFVLLCLSIELVACAMDQPQAQPVPTTLTGNEGTAAPCAETEPTTETVRVTNEYGALEGTLDVPARCGPVPVIVLLSGSGSTDRDGNKPGAKARPSLYATLSDAFVQSGIAVLRYDDPGIAGSQDAAPSRVEDFRYETEVDAAARFLARVRGDDRFDAVLAAGHSQGSLTAMLAAKTQPLDGFVSLAGPGRPAGDVLREQVSSRLSSEDAATLDAAIAALEAGDLPGPLAPPLDSILPEFVQPYYASWMKYDPKKELATMTAPALIIQGRLDVQVGEADARLLVETKPDAELLLVDDMGHMLREVSSISMTSQEASYTQPMKPHPDVLRAVTSFVFALPRP